MWLERASEGGQSEADEYLLRMDQSPNQIAR